MMVKNDGVFWDTNTFIGGGGMLMNVILQLQCIDNDNLFCHYDAIVRMHSFRCLPYMQCNKVII